MNMKVHGVNTPFTPVERIGPSTSRRSGRGGGSERAGKTKQAGDSAVNAAIQAPVVRRSGINKARPRMRQTIAGHYHRALEAAMEQMQHPENPAAREGMMFALTSVAGFGKR